MWNDLYCFLVSESADSHKGVSVSFRGYANGQRIVTDSGTMGGNSQAVGFFSNLKTAFMVIGIITIIIGIINLIKAKNFAETASVKIAGRVLAVDQASVIIEHDDGSRKRYSYVPSSTIIVNGNQGVFEIKNNIVIGFTK